MDNPFGKRQKANSMVRCYVERPHWLKVHGQVRQVFEGWVVDAPLLEAREGFELGRVREVEPGDPPPITLDEIHAFMVKRQEDAEVAARRRRALDRARQMEAEDALLAKHGMAEAPAEPRKRGKQTESAA